jgi:hypothetical protein
VSTKKAIASGSSISIILALTALVSIWAGPRFGLNIKTQVLIVGAFTVIVKTAYFLAVELNEESDGKPASLKPDAEAESNGPVAGN